MASGSALPLVFFAALVAGTWTVGGIACLVRAVFPTHTQVIGVMVALAILAVSLGVNLAGAGRHHPDPERACIGPPSEIC